MPFVLPETSIPPIVASDEVVSADTTSGNRSRRSRKEETVVTLEENQEDNQEDKQEVAEEGQQENQEEKKGVVEEGKEENHEEDGHDSPPGEDGPNSDVPPPEKEEEVVVDEQTAEELERTHTLKQLRDMCTERGLPSNGKKGELAKRLVA